ncbi:hypothetical protein Tcan_00196 [Toxocara canis]|uniref:Uncharacterized protein n=1 Tax=Toxocara canis TaxID=6265 RepID=A0A0B2VTI0_TOXCA|nr:hypothetical protein Tcan_00196 [Toxocara canis]
MRYAARSLHQFLTAVRPSDGPEPVLIHCYPNQTWLRKLEMSILHQLIQKMEIGKKSLNSPLIWLLEDARLGHHDRCSFWDSQLTVYKFQTLEESVRELTVGTCTVKIFKKSMLIYKKIKAQKNQFLQAELPN